MNAEEDMVVEKNSVIRPRLRPSGDYDCSFLNFPLIQSLIETSVGSFAKQIKRQQELKRNSITLRKICGFTCKTEQATDRLIKIFTFMDLLGFCDELSKIALLSLSTGCRNGLIGLIYSQLCLRLNENFPDDSFTNPFFCKMDLYVRFVSSVCLPASQKICHRFPNLVWLELDLFENSNFDFSETNLETLIIYNKVSTICSFPTKWPVTLKSLSIDVSARPITSKHLPSTLTSLRLTKRVHLQGKFEFPSLSVIECCCDNSSFYFSDNMKTMTFCTRKMKPAVFELPRLGQVVNLIDLDGHQYSVKNLPDCIVNLSLSGTVRGIVFPNLIYSLAISKLAKFVQIPRSVVRLTIGFFHEELAPDLLPPNLEFLDLGEFRQDIAPKVLPQSLLFLRLDQWEEKHKNSLNLPSNLTGLFLPSTKTLSCPLPKTLKFLALAHCPQPVFHLSKCRNLYYVQLDAGCNVIDTEKQTGLHLMLSYQDLLGSVEFKRKELSESETFQMFNVNKTEKELIELAEKQPWWPDQ